jgi:hypothetical protein
MGFVIRSIDKLYEPLRRFNEEKFREAGRAQVKSESTEFAAHSVAQERLDMRWNGMDHADGIPHLAVCPPSGMQMDVGGSAAPVT